MIFNAIEFRVMTHLKIQNKCVVTYFVLIFNLHHIKLCSALHVCVCVCVCARVRQPPNNKLKHVYSIESICTWIRRACATLCTPRVIF